MRLSIATKVFLGFVRGVGFVAPPYPPTEVARLQRIGRGLSLLSRPYMPLTRAVSTLEAFHKERERSMDSLLDQSDPKMRANLNRARPDVLRSGSRRAARLCATVGGCSANRRPRIGMPLDRIAARLYRGGGARDRRREGRGRPHNATADGARRGLRGSLAGGRHRAAQDCAAARRPRGPARSARSCRTR